jgi:hypothetical protein
VFHVWENFFLLRLSVNGKEIHCHGSLHDGSDEGDGGSTSSTTFLEQRHGSLSFPNGDIEAEMLSLSWNNFLHPLLCFAVVRSNHSERLVIISPPPAELMLISHGSDRLRFVSLLHQW